MTHHETNNKDNKQQQKKDSNSRVDLKSEPKNQDELSKKEQAEQRKQQDNLQHPERASENKDARESIERSRFNEQDTARSVDREYTTTVPNQENVIVSERHVEQHPKLVGQEQTEIDRQERIKVQDANLGQTPHGITPAATQSEPVKDTIDAQIHSKQRQVDIQNEVSGVQQIDPNAAFIQN